MESIFSALLSLLLLEADDAKIFVVEHLFDCFFAPRLRTAAAAAAAEETTTDAEEEEAIIVRCRGSRGDDDTPFFVFVRSAR
jgi:hypothetical protein